MPSSNDPRLLSFVMTTQSVTVVHCYPAMYVRLCVVTLIVHRTRNDATTTPWECNARFDNSPTL